MFIINIAVNSAITPEQQESLFPRHVQWFKQHFSTGKFVVVGPFTDQPRAGVIIANIEDQDELMALLREDAYYPDRATYEIRAFSPLLIAENFPQLQKK